MLIIKFEIFEAPNLKLHEADCINFFRYLIKSGF